MAFNSTYKTTTESRPIYDAELAHAEVKRNTSRAITIRFAHDRALKRLSK